MTVADLWGAMPLLILATGALAVLLIGAVTHGRGGTPVGVLTLLGAAAWSLLAPQTAGSPTWVSFTPFARFFTMFFSLTALLVLLLSHDYNERRGIRGEEYPATVLFAVFGMTVLSSAVNLLTLFLGLEGLTFAFYFLVAIDRERPESGEAGLKYLVMGAVAAAFTAFAIALLYAGTGVLGIREVVAALTTGGREIPWWWPASASSSPESPSRFPWCRPICGPRMYTKGRRHRW